MPFYTIVCNYKRHFCATVAMVTIEIFQNDYYESLIEIKEQL